MSLHEAFLDGRVQNVYDSHLHWQGIGAMARRLRLHELRAPEDVANLNIESQHYRGEWLLGRGWDQNKFAVPEFPDRHSLDRVFGATPVYFTRVDGHAAWLNTEALKRSGLWSREVQRDDVLKDAEGWPTGIILDLAMAIAEKGIPSTTKNDVKENLLRSQEALHAAGITHIRDMSCSELQWQAACELADSNELHLAVEQFFGLDEPSRFDRQLQLCLEAQKHHPRLIRPQGVKVFFDGALGSEGALISQPYASTQNHGLQLLEENQLAEMMHRCWDQGVDIAVHVIGDEAADKVVRVARFAQNSFAHGLLHLEHAELLRPETIKMMSGLRVRCHMQPCHWLSDKSWLRNKIGDLADYAFPWRSLEEEKIDFSFGSDAPIEPLGLPRNRDAVVDAAKADIQAPVHSWLRYHTHQDLDWPGNTYTDFKNDQVGTVTFGGEVVYQNPSLTVGGGPPLSRSRLL